MSGWVHSDPRGLDVALNAASKRALTGQWDTSVASVADARALLAGCALSAASLTTAPAPPLHAQRVVMPDFLAPGAFADLASMHAAGAFLRVAPLLAGGKALGAQAPTIHTAGGGPAILVGADAGGFDFLEAAKTAGSLALLGPLGAPVQFAYAALHAQELAFELSGAKDDVIELQVALEALRVAVVSHQAEEAKAGRPLPWNDAEKRTLAAVLSAQEKMAKRKGLAWLVPGSDPLSFLRPSVEQAAKGAWTLAKIFAVGAGLGLVAWAAWETRK